MSPIVPVLVNPTPMEVVMPYDRGRKIRIPADSELTIDYYLADDFRPDKPGYEAVRELLEYYGIFLKNTDISYDFQALTALKASRKAKNSQLQAFMDGYHANAVRSGTTVSEATIKEAMNRSGHNRLVEEIEVLDHRIKVFEEVTAKDPTRGRVDEQLDPTRTCFASQPPKVFSSPTALKIYLDEHPKLKAEHEKFLKALKE